VRLGQHPLRAQRRAASLTPPAAGAGPRARTDRAAGVSSAGDAAAAHSRNAARGASHASAPAGEREDAVGGGQAALEAVLDEDDGRPPLLVEPPQQPDQLVAGDGVELRRRLVEQDERGRPGERGAERDALQLAAGELVRRAVEQRRDARARAPPPPPRARPPPAPCRGSRAGRRARRDRAEHDLRLGVLRQRPGHRGDVGRAVLAGVEAADDDPAAELAAVEVRHEPARRAHDRRLARGRQPGDDDELARARREATRRAARARRARVACRSPGRSAARSRADPPAVGERQQRADGERAHSASLRGAPRRDERGNASKPATPASCARDDQRDDPAAEASEAASWRDHGARRRRAAPRVA
jgi:hypothetical protein